MLYYTFIWLLVGTLVGLCTRSYMIVKEMGNEFDKIGIPAIAVVLGPISFAIGVIYFVINWGSLLLAGYIKYRKEDANRSEH